jgi:hypothetical protein
MDMPSFDFGASTYIAADNHIKHVNITYTGYDDYNVT